jgi:hypothetical protein
MEPEQGTGLLGRARHNGFLLHSASCPVSVEAHSRAAASNLANRATTLDTKNGRRSAENRATPNESIDPEFTGDMQAQAASTDVEPRPQFAEIEDGRTFGQSSLGMNTSFPRGGQ